MTTESVDTDKIKRIFLPYAAKERERIRNDGGRLVYYTTADVAFSILKNQEIWMRNAMTMTDYSEVEYGLQCLIDVYKPVALQLPRWAS